MTEIVNMETEISNTITEIVNVETEIANTITNTNQNVFDFIKEPEKLQILIKVNSLFVIFIQYKIKRRLNIEIIRRSQYLNRKSKKLRLITD